MAGRIPRTFIDDLLNRVDIVEIIDARVPLKKKGRDYWACCPFHNEKSPSFSVSQQKQFYNCFGCQQHGNAIGFLMDYDHMDFVEAVEALAQHIGIEVPYEKGSAPAHSQTDTSASGLFTAMTECSLFYQQQLKQSPQAIEYLQQRGISGATAKSFAIGFAPKGWNNLNGNEADLIESGMLIRNEAGKVYDRFRHRLMFPIRNRKGQTIAFGGRIIDPNDTPKYLNSPESPVFHKGEEIYGLYELKQANTNIDSIFVTEGYMDVVALAEHGITTGVATLGTAINGGQVEKLFRLSKKLVFCFDADAAGRKAAWRALEASLGALKEGRLARFLFLPDGHDPDTFIREFGNEPFLEKAKTATPLSKFLIDNLVAQGDLTSMEGKTLFIDKLIYYLKQIPLEALQKQIIQQAGRLVTLKGDQKSLDRLEGTLSQDSTPITVAEAHWTPVRMAITLLLLQPSLGLGVGNLDHLYELDVKGITVLLRLLDIIQEEPEITTQNLLHRFSGDESETFLYRLASKPPAFNNENEEIPLMLEDSINHLRAKYSENRFNQLQKKLISGQSLSESEKQEYRKFDHKKAP